MTHTINGVIITPEILETLKYFQANDNENIDYHIRFLNEIEDKIFAEGRERDSDDPKNDLFKELEELRTLKENLDKLKVYDKEQ